MTKLSPSRKISRAQLKRDFQELVGGEVYATWILMLRKLAPRGRTHRLAVLVAGILQYASSCQSAAKKDNSVTQRLAESDRIGMDYDTQNRIILPLIEQLFKDADVAWKRTNARGQSYSIAEQSLDEFLRWDFMPWE